MRRFTIILSLLAVGAASPPAALGKARATDRPVSGTSSSTTTVDLATGTGSVAGSGRLSQLGRFTFTNDITSFTLTGPDTFRLTLTAILVAANGDRVCTTATGTGTLTPTGSETTLVSTITGGTGRFAAASGRLTSRISSAFVSTPGATTTMRDSETHRGRISYSPRRRGGVMGSGLTLKQWRNAWRCAAASRSAPASRGVLGSGLTRQQWRDAWRRAAESAVGRGAGV
jgi:hypothetical protein